MLPESLYVYLNHDTSDHALMFLSQLQAPPSSPKLFRFSTTGRNVMASLISCYKPRMMRAVLATLFSD